MIVQDVMEKRRWHQVADEPNAPEVHAWRARRLAQAHRPPVVNRVEYLADLARGKRVLDVGVVDHAVRKQSTQAWLHAHIARAAAECLGVDLLKDGIDRLAEAGYNVRQCDITDPAAAAEVGGPFDLMICGELLEHLDAPGGMFAAARRLLSPRGRLVVTMPNLFQIWAMLRCLTSHAKESADHVLCVGPWHAAELAERHHMRLESYRGTIIANSTAKHRIVFQVGRRLSPVFNPDFFCTTMIYEFVLDSSA